MVCSQSPQQVAHPCKFWRSHPPFLQAAHLMTKCSRLPPSTNNHRQCCTPFPVKPNQISAHAHAQAASELFKLLLVALSAATSASAPQPTASAEQAVLHLLVPLAVAAVAPEQQGSSPPQGLKSLVLQLVPRLAAGPSAPAFRAALTSLKPASIQRLQVKAFPCF